MSKIIVFLLALVVFSNAYAQNQDIKKLLEKMQKRIENLEKSNSELKQKLEQVEKNAESKSRLDHLEKDIEDEVDDLLGDMDSEEVEGETSPIFTIPLTGNASLQLLDISLSALITAGASTARDEELQQLELNDHDPKKRGFTLQQTEFAAEGAIDPYVRGYINFILFIDQEGETIVELEEAFFVTQTLPYGLQAKIGQFFTEFGIQNTIHPHSWGFADQSAIVARFFGPDGLRNPGARVSWLVPGTGPAHIELLGSVQNANGETAVSFLSTDEEAEGFGAAFAGHNFIERDVRSFRDLLYLTRLAVTLDLTEEITAKGGFSFLAGPNATGNNADTFIYGWDLYIKWQPKQNKKGFPFVAWQSEILYRHYEAEAGEGINVDEDLEDWGAYTQILWGFYHQWVLGVRYDFAKGERGEADRDFTRDEKHRISANVTYYPSDFFKIRLQYNWDKQFFLGSSPEHSIFLQFEFLLGKHAAHKF